MRKVLFSLLLATAMATPAIAADWPGHRDRSSDDQSRPERSDSRQDRSESRQARSDARRDRAEAREARSEARNDGADARQPAAEATQARAEAQKEQGQVRDRAFQDRGDHVAQGADAARMEAAAREAQARREREANVNERGRPTLGNRNDGDTVSNWRGQRDAQSNDGDWRRQRDGQRTDGNWRDRHGGTVRVPTGARPDRPAPVPQTAYNHNDRTPKWDRNWRNDHRHHDWRNYRNHHRSSFHLGVYLDPFGWGYQRYNIGWRLWPNYYSSSYWLNDPSMYALPYAPWPYRWVRYYDDAILVDTYTGQVVDVMYDFFW